MVFIIESWYHLWSGYGRRVVLSRHRLLLLNQAAQLVVEVTLHLHGPLHLRQSVQIVHVHVAHAGGQLGLLLLLRHLQLGLG